MLFTRSIRRKMVAGSGRPDADARPARDRKYLKVCPTTSGPSRIWNSLRQLRVTHVLLARSLS